MAAVANNEPSGAILSFRGTTLFSGSASPISWTGTATVSQSDGDNWIGYTGTMADEITALTSLTGSGLVFSNSTLAGLGAPIGDSGLAVGPVSGSASPATGTIAYSFASAVPAGNSLLLWAPGALFGSYTGPFTYTFSASLNGHAVSTAGWSFSVQSPQNGSIPFTDTINAATGTITLNNYTNGNFAVIVATPNNSFDHVSVAANTIEEDAWGLAFSNASATPAPTNLALSPASDTGTGGDGITSDTTPTITGSGQAGDTVTLYSGGTTVLGQAIVAGNGTWSITAAALAPGTYGLTATEADSSGDTSAQSASLALTITGNNVTVGFFNNTFAANVSAAYKSSVVAAEDDITGRWAAPSGYQINLQFDAEAAGQSSFLGSNSWSDTIDVTYVQLTAALAAHDGGSIYAQDAVASLPAVDPNPQGGKDWSLPDAYARMLGLTTETPAIDDTVTLNTSYNWNYGQDVASTLEHEISEGAMGRIGGLGDQNSLWSTMDLFRYTSAGVPDYQDGRDRVTTYFSYDGGAHTSASAGLSFHNEYKGANQVDTDDTADFDQQDVFGTGSPGDTLTLSQTDIEMMDVLGWLPVGSAPHVAPTVNVQNVSVQQNAAISASTMITGLSNPSGDSVTAYEFIDEGTGGGFFQVNGTAQATNQRIEVATGNLASIQYVGGPSPASETLEVGVYDATTNSYSNYSPLTATTTASPSQYDAQIIQFYQQILNRTPAASEVAGWESALSNGLSLAQVRTAIADSSEAHNDISGLYQTILGRTPAAAEIAGWQNVLANGSSLTQVRTAFAASTEAQNDISGLYQTILGRTPAAIEVSAWQSALANSLSLAQIRTGIAASPESQGDLIAIFQNVEGRAPDQAELAGIENQIAAAGASQTSVANGLAGNGPTGFTIVTPPAGNASLTALAGPERFDFSAGNFGNDTVVGFNDAQDAIELSHTLAGGFAAIQADAHAVSGGTLITLDASHSILLDNVTPSSLAAANFHFV